MYWLMPAKFFCSTENSAHGILVKTGLFLDEKESYSVGYWWLEFSRQMQTLYGTNPLTLGQQTKLKFIFT